jgi:hypothetical protein
MPDDGTENRAVLDMSSGAGVTCLGHSAQSIKDAMVEQIQTMPYTHSAQWTSHVVEQAAQLLLDEAGVAFMQGAVTFYSGGSEAIEAACKLAAQIIDYENPGRPIVFVGRKHSYHGNTAFALALGDHPRKAALSRSRSWSGIGCERFEAFASQYDMSGPNSLDSLADLLMRHHQRGARCVVVIEPVGGTTIGIAHSSPEYLAGVRALCSSHNAILIHDEVLCGNYRTGFLLASQYYQSQNREDCMPDIAVLGKGITGGYFPMSAVMLSSALHARFPKHKESSLWHTSTNQNHPIGAAAINAAIPLYRSYLNDAIPELSWMIVDSQTTLLADDSPVIAMTGVGTLWGLHFDPHVGGLHRVYKDAMMVKGVACYSEGGTIEGAGHMWMLAPPLTLRREQFASIVGAVLALGTDR